MQSQTDNRSLAEAIATRPIEDQEQMLRGLSTSQALELWHDWDFWAREDQKSPPGDWTTWLIQAGRGFGKTRIGAETIHWWEKNSQEIFGISRGQMRFALVGRTAADIRDTMIEGESGLLAVARPSERPRYLPSSRRILWPSGSMATTFSTAEPDLLRGPQHHAAWGDEVATWSIESYDNLQFGLRLGTRPRQVLTTTPRPVQLMRDLIRQSQEGDDIVVTRGSTYDNRANLAEAFYKQIITKYEGTRVGRQELMGDFLEDVEGALWTRLMIDQSRIEKLPEDDSFGLRKVVVGVDPAGGGSDEIGIVAAGIGTDGEWYVLADHSLHGRPQEWARQVGHLYHAVRADYIVAERNYGGDMVEATIKTADRSLPVRMVTASRGKSIRAQPISLAYERGVVHHVGMHDLLEDQLCNWVPEDAHFSPDRLDALVWALTELRAGILPGGIGLRM
jgi:phage terminase large subunit-like protein